MTKIDDLRYKAEDGYTFVHKETKVRYGNRIYLGSASIDEFIEEPMTEEELTNIERKEREMEDRKKDRISKFRGRKISDFLSEKNAEKVI